MRANEGNALLIVGPDPSVLKAKLREVGLTLEHAMATQAKADCSCSLTLGKLTQQWESVVRSSSDEREFESNLRLLAALAIWGMASMNTYQPLIEAQPKGEQNADTNQGDQPVEDQPKGR